MSEAPPPTDEFPDEKGVQVGMWEAALTSYYSHEVLKDPAFGFRIHNTPHVISIHHYKKASHEYIVAKVKVPDLDEIRFLWIEHFQASTNASEARGSHHSLSRVTTATSQDSAALCLKSFPASDEIKTLTRWPSAANNICHHRYKCEGSQTKLLDLALAARVVSDSCGDYQIYKSQCFQFANTVIGILQQHFPQMKEKRSPPGSDSDSDEVEVDDRKMGKHKSVRIYTRDVSMINDLHGHFTTHKDKVLAIVSLFNTDGFLLTNYCL